MNNNLVLLERCYDMTQAHILRGLLETNDIPCFLMDEHHSAVAWHLTTAIGGLRIMVMEQDLEQARSMIGIIEETTPKISKPFLRKPYLRNILLSLFGLFSGAPLIWPQKENKE